MPAPLVWEFSPGIPSRAARGLLGSEVKSTMDFGAQTIAQQKNTLRTWFVRYFDDGMTKEDVENWFDTLGACTGKGEISESKEKLDFELWVKRARVVATTSEIAISTKTARKNVVDTSSYKNIRKRSRAHAGNQKIHSFEVKL